VHWEGLWSSALRVRFVVASLGVSVLAAVLAIVTGAGIVLGLVAFSNA
jgi:hypothetical protein